MIIEAGVIQQLSGVHLSARSQTKKGRYGSAESTVFTGGGGDHYSMSSADHISLYDSPLCQASAHDRCGRLVLIIIESQVYHTLTHAVTV